MIDTCAFYREPAESSTCSVPAAAAPAAAATAAATATEASGDRRPWRQQRRLPGRASRPQWKRWRWRRRGFWEGGERRGWCGSAAQRPPWSRLLQIPEVAATSFPAATAGTSIAQLQDPWDLYPYSDRKRMAENKWVRVGDWEMTRGSHRH